MKKDKISIILMIMIFIGLSVMLYPTISNQWNLRTQTRAIATYNRAVTRLSDKDYDRYFKEAEEYNKKVRYATLDYYNPNVITGYEKTLDIFDNGIMGYVTIEKLKVELPIYHGTDDSILQIAAGHLEGTELPIGGKGNHSVISAHRGLPSARLFTDLDRMEEGDTFTVTVLNRVLTYQVDQISIVKPEDTSKLQPVDGKDYCTLMTCTPYGINSHRMLVRGVRVDGRSLGEYIPTDAYEIHSFLVSILIAIPLLAMILIGYGIKFILEKRKLAKEMAGKDEKETA